MTDVFLHVYDVANSDSEKTNNAVLQVNKIFKDGIGLGGIFHSAVEVYGKLEWSFGFCELGSGVFSCRRTENPMYKYRESFPLGRTELPPSRVRSILIELSQEWQGSSYDLLAKNCNHFCNAFCEKLGVEKLPGWVNRFANAGEAAYVAAATTMKGLRQAKMEIMSASQVAYRTLFGGGATVSPDPGLSEGSTSNGGRGGNILRLPFMMKTPVSLFSRFGIGSTNQVLNESAQAEDSTCDRKDGSSHGGDEQT